MYSRHRSIQAAGFRVRPVIMACSFAVVATALAGCAHMRQAVGLPDVVIGTASPADVDYPLGGSICRLFNLNTPRHGVRCAEELSKGAVANVEALRHGSIDIGIVPSDVLADAVAGQGSFATKGPATNLRVLFAGHSDIFTVVAHQGSGIHTVADLRGKRVGVGSPGSRQSIIMARLMAAIGLKWKDFAEVRELSPAEQNRAFCANELDAIVYSVAHPNGLIRDATHICNGTLVAAGSPNIDRLLSQYKEYEHAVIPGGTYRSNPEDVNTFGVRAVVVTTTRMSDTVAYEITRAVFDRFDDFRRLHPAFKALSVADMVRPSGGAPIHGGAARYYREHGWGP